MLLKMFCGLEKYEKFNKNYVVELIITNKP